MFAATLFIVRDSLATYKSKILDSEIFFLEMGDSL